MDEKLTPRFAAAKAQQLRYEGRPCRKCGNTTRYTINADCTVCSNERAKVYVTKARARLRSMLRGEAQPDSKTGVA